MAPKSLALLALGALTLAGNPADAQDVHQTALHDYRVVTVAEGLVNPWSMAFLPGGDMLVTERPGRLRVVRNGELLPSPVAGVPEVFARGQGGLLDVVAHPDFATNRMLYISYSKPLGEDASTTAVIRGRFENDRLMDVEEIFEAQSQGRGHYGSRIVFDGNGYVFITVGDRQARPAGDLEAHPAQDLSNHHGVVVRLHEDGRVPQDNPFVGQSGALPEIWSYGHRNPQAMAMHPGTGDLWATEHGPQGGDELNLIQPGENYGWPVVGYGVNVYDGDAFPNWRGHILAGGLSGGRIDRIAVEGQEVGVAETVLHGMGRVRDIRQGPDGYIYVAIDHRGGNPTPIIRLEPVN